MKCLGFSNSACSVLVHLPSREVALCIAVGQDINILLGGVGGETNLFGGELPWSGG